MHNTITIKTSSTQFNSFQKWKKLLAERTKTTC